MNDRQLEFSLPKPRSCRRTPRQARAHWWFERMRQIIDLAPTADPKGTRNMKFG